MQALTPVQYAELRRLADSWERRYLRHAKQQRAYNPRLGVDALCFSQIQQDGASYLLGALVTPLSMSLMMVPASGHADCPARESVRWLSLPSGEYPLRPLALGADDWVWHCEMLDDLSDVGSLGQGSRLAQRLMTSIMSEPS